MISSVRLRAFEDPIAFDMGAYAGGLGGRVAEMTIGSLPSPYVWEAYEVTLDGMRTNKTPVGVMRGPANFEATVVRERLLDIAARRLGLSPVELRRRNLLPAEALPYHVELGPDLADEQVGAGLALFVNHSGYGTADSVRLRLTEEGRFDAATTGTEVGQGLDEMLRAVTSRSLGVDPGIVDVRSGEPGGAPLRPAKNRIAPPGGIARVSGRNSTIPVSPLSPGMRPEIDPAIVPARSKRTPSKLSASSSASKKPPARTGLTRRPARTPRGSGPRTTA